MQRPDGEKNNLIKQNMNALLYKITSSHIQMTRKNNLINDSLPFCCKHGCDIGRARDLRFTGCRFESWLDTFV